MASDLQAIAEHVRSLAAGASPLMAAVHGARRTAGELGTRAARLRSTGVAVAPVVMAFHAAAGAIDAALSELDALRREAEAYADALATGGGTAGSGGSGAAASEAPSASNTALELTFRSDDRDPDEVWRTAFAPLDAQNDDLERFVAENRPSNFVSTSRDPELYRDWHKRYRYLVISSGGLDVNELIPGNRYAREQEVAYRGGIPLNRIAGAYLVLPDGSLGPFIRNPFYGTRRP